MLQNFALRIGVAAVAVLLSAPLVWGQSVVLSAAITNFPQTGGTALVGISAPAGFTWTITNAGFVSFRGIWTGTGSKVLAFDVPPNLISNARVAKINISGAILTITQAGIACVSSLAPGALAPPANGEAGVVQPTVNSPDCGWNASSDKPWITVFPLVANGPTPVHYNAYPNFGTKPRSASLDIGGRAVAVNQPGSTGTEDRRFVILAYFYFFGRVPTEEEINFNVKALTDGLPRSVLVQNFMNSLEFAIAGRFIAGTYVGLLDRLPEYGGWLFIRSAFARGEANQLVIVQNFLNSAEFNVRWGVLTNAAFIRLLYRLILLREATDAEVLFNEGVLAAGMSREVMAMNFLNAAEFRLLLGPKLTAFLFYATLFQRDPTGPEVDLVIAQLAAGNSLSTIANAFINNAEFRAFLE